ncbi:hypothetical protein HMPREF9145_1794 [Segatella salivae F0493]|uniref:Uncharacterized protein n=1 Tax=Segatella salivae F0493 TaxID=1395125 RepID=U2L2E6_9BACT|nr:hypothetical protein HMPREF9145_1794 [Segatella salivae F0493]
MINEMSFHKHFFQISLMKDGSRPSKRGLLSSFIFKNAENLHSFSFV